MDEEKTKKDSSGKEGPKAPEASGMDEGAGEGLMPLADALGGEAPDMGVAGGAGEGEWAPSMDWLMGSVGPFFNNNQGIGELLLDKLKESGVNTEGIALAGLVNVLQQFSKEYKALSEAVGNNLDRINELSAENQDLSAKLQEIVREMGLTEEDGGQPPAIGSGLGGDAGGGMPPDMGAPPGADMGVAPPPDMGVAPPPDMGVAPPPDMGGGMDAGMPPAGDMGAPPDMGGGMPPDMGTPPPGGDVMSDERMKQKVVSDRRMKRLVREAGRRANRGTRASGGIIRACMGDLE